MVYGEASRAMAKKFKNEYELGTRTKLAKNF